MAKKISKEMVEALKTAKSPEDVTKILGAEGFDIQKLSLDDLDQVSGGADGTITINGITFSESEFNSFILTVYNTSGFTKAYAMFQAYTGSEGLHEYVESGDIDLILYHYWMNREDGGGF